MSSYVTCIRARAVFFVVSIAVIALFLAAQPANAQQLGTVAGKVLDATGAPAEGIEVRLVELRRRAATDSAGEFRFEDVPPGRYLVES